jgi:Protein of unknown function (FYDLN_acid)
MGLRHSVESSVLERKMGPETPIRTGEPLGEARSKLGTRYVCFRCGAKFYDLNRPEPLCPK